MCVCVWTVSESSYGFSCPQGLLAAGGYLPLHQRDYLSLHKKNQKTESPVQPLTPCSTIVPLGYSATADSLAINTKKPDLIHTHIIHS